MNGNSKMPIKNTKIENVKCFDNNWEPKVSVSVTVAVSVTVTTTFVFMCRLESDCLSCCHKSYVVSPKS